MMIYSLRAKKKPKPRADKWSFFNKHLSLTTSLSLWICSKFVCFYLFSNCVFIVHLLLILYFCFPHMCVSQECLRILASVWTKLFKRSIHIQSTEQWVKCSDWHWRPQGAVKSWAGVACLVTESKSSTTLDWEEEQSISFVVQLLTGFLHKLSTFEKVSEGVKSQWLKE